MVYNSARGSTMKSDRDSTKEATLATLKLKDMLGIGGDDKSTNKSQIDPASNSNKNMAKEVSKKKKKPKVSNNGKSKKSRENSLRQSKGQSSPSLPAQSSSKQNNKSIKSGDDCGFDGGGGNGTPIQPKVKHNDKKGRKSKSGATGVKNDNALDGNYAWSAFQSPPDASALPLPFFSSNSPKCDVNSEVKSDSKGETEGLISSLSISEPTLKEPPQKADFVKSKVENKQSVQALAPEDHIKAILNIEQSPSSNRGTIKSTQDGKNKQDNGISDQKEAALTNKQLNTSSGVNLAALASPVPTSSPSKIKSSINKSSQNNPSFPTVTKVNQHERDPIAMLMNGQSYGTTNPTMTSSPHYSHYPVHQQPHSNGYQQQQLMMQHHAHAPQFITVQVQVPPVLLPGRQMMVSAGPGYSVPIVVPEGVHPGMVIPVTIPTHSPSPGQIGGPMSPVMIPRGTMMQLNVGSPSQQMYSNQEDSHQYSQSHFVTPQQQISKKGPEPGSWAARAAAPPQNGAQQSKSTQNN